MKLYNDMKCKHFVFVLVLGMFSFLCASCDSEDEIIDPRQVCFEFYELNKNLNFENLYYMNIPCVRQYLEYDSKKNEYVVIPVFVCITDTVNDDSHILLPVFKDGADNTKQHRSFALCNVAAMEYLKRKYDLAPIANVFDFYAKEVNDIYRQYNNIKVPRALHKRNVFIEGRGNYIKFILHKDEEKKIEYSCYYVRDTIFSNDNLKNYFKTLPQFDEHWYYKIVSGEE